MPTNRKPIHPYPALEISSGLFSFKPLSRLNKTSMTSFVFVVRIYLFLMPYLTKMEVAIAALSAISKFHLNTVLPIHCR